MNELDRYLLLKGQEYQKFDPNRAKNIYAQLKTKLKHTPYTIQVIGTNGKGTSGRFLSLALLQKGFRVLHFTSPHIFRFNERFYKNGSIISDDELLIAHRYLMKFDFIKEASYFEYATFLALHLAFDVDYLILEAGVGGEYDSTSVLDRDLHLFTLIDYDHQDMLGDNINDIATTKLNAMTNIAILGIQKHDIIKDIATSIALSKDVKLYILDSISNDAMNYVKKHNMANFLAENLSLALKALEFLGVEFDVKCMPKLDLIGRFQKIADNIIIDVGHNQSAALAIKENLKNKKVTLVYNSYIQKDIKKILKILKENIVMLEIMEIIDNSRVIDKMKLIEILDELEIPYSDFKHIDNTKDYLVFGSFSVVEKFMREVL